LPESGICSREKGFQQRKLPKDTGKSPVFRKRIFLSVIGAVKEIAAKDSNKSIIKTAWIGFSETCGFILSGEDTVKLSVTLLKLDSLWHLSQLLLQHGLGFENNEKEINE
jgi:hypothetical protein